MKSFQIIKDLYRIRTYFGLSQSEMATKLAYSRSNIARYENGSLSPSARFVEDLYAYAFTHGFPLNSSKAQFFEEEKEKGAVVLFHGARGEIVGDIDTKHSIPPNDFGGGFYAGESLKQAAMWVCSEQYASVYCFSFNPKGYKSLSFRVDQNWMNAILYYRGAFKDREIPEKVKELVSRIEECDFIIAPIADNSMYETLNLFVNNTITDEACIHALSATDLGMQYVFKKDAVCSKLQYIDRLYLCKEEKDFYKSTKSKETNEGKNKAKFAKIEYGRKGYYFDEIYKRK